MKFIDEAIITVRGGNGGNGIVHFARTKFNPKGGPDGGDGGNGGDVIAVADVKKLTLLDFKFKKEFKAEDGRDGGTNRKTGKSGKDLIIQLPLGTKILDKDSGKLLGDITRPNCIF
ncbi:MAG: GTPase ObgE, partial [Deltaproteobacteria bacterium]|nr:GTPase ObgE [Deltaproteobacteria bacterium]